MKSVKLLVLGGILTGIAVLLQIIPVFFSEAFVLLTLLSALPVYILCRIKPAAGISACLSASILIFSISFHEGIFFVFANGIVGLSLGLGKYYFCRSSSLPVITGSLALTASLCTAALVLGINVFGTRLPFNIPLQIASILAFSVVYCLLYAKLADGLYRRLSKLYNPRQ